jgi:hypothetical protein
MPSFSRPKSERAPAARFENVTRGKLQAPSWVASQLGTAAHLPESASLKPPPIPAEARVSAFPAAHPANPVPAAPAKDSHGSTPDFHAVRSSDMRTGLAERLPTIPPESIPRPASIAPPPSASVNRALVEALDHAVAALGDARKKVFDATALEIVELATVIARRVIGRELSIDPGLVEGLVREGIDALGQHDRLVVRLGNRFAEAGEALARRLQTNGTTVDLVLDPELDEYGCIVETNLGRVDESIETRLATLLEALESDSRPPGA